MRVEWPWLWLPPSYSCVSAGPRRSHWPSCTWETRLRELGLSPPRGGDRGPRWVVQGVTGMFVSPDVALLTVLLACTTFGLAVHLDTDVILIA